ncbi:MAG TPA: helix-turn-helix domain-containing protein [Polyangiaceae bacterium]|nr:helix-turn-helix domain-containing protein [Polyangiaceae bacterium]
MPGDDDDETSDPEFLEWLEWSEGLERGESDPEAFRWFEGDGWIPTRRIVILPRGQSAGAPPTTPQRAKRAPKALPASTPNGRWLTLVEASELIRTPAETIRYWVWQGRLQAFKPGRSLLVDREELEAFVADRETVAVRASKLRKG